MIQPGRYDIGADRWVACIRTLAFVGFDFTDATFAMHVRLTPDAGGSPLVALATVVLESEGVRLLYGGTDTIANHITAGRLTEAPDAINPATGVGYVAADSIALSLVKVRINETSMEGLPFPDEVGDDAVLAWDMHITPSGGIKDKYLGGTFTVRAGVTQ